MTARLHDLMTPPGNILYNQFIVGGHQVFHHGMTGRIGYLINPVYGQNFGRGTTEENSLH